MTVIIKNNTIRERLEVYQSEIKEKTKIQRIKVCKFLSIYYFMLQNITCKKYINLKMYFIGCILFFLTMLNLFCFL